METVIHAIAGGALIGIAAAGLLLINGRVAGISGIFAGTLRPTATHWTLAFIGGLVAAGILARLSGFAATPETHLEPPLILAAAGLLVGIGTRIGNGCTSGHGVCGLANLSPRSLVATLVFMAVAGLTVFIARHVL